MTTETSNEVSSPRSFAALVTRQVEAIDAWNEARAKRERLYTEPGGHHTREMRLDFGRRLEALHRADEAMRDRTAAHLAREPEVLLHPPPVRAVVAHRQEWFTQKITEALGEQSVRVLATDNGAAALGMVVAEQPDLLFVEDKLPMLPGDELLAEAAIFAPATLLAAQVEHGDLVGRMLDAGARAAWTRQTPPADVAAELAALLSRRTL